MRENSNSNWPDNILEHELLAKNLSIDQAKKIQDKWVLIKTGKEKNHEISEISTLKGIKFVAGVDLSYYEPENNPVTFGVACAVLYNLHNEEEPIISTIYSKGEVTFSYHPGLLGFREMPLAARAIIKLPQRPDIIMYDGHGELHPKKFGAAVQLGMALKTPSIGVAKNPLIMETDRWKQLERKKGNKLGIYHHGQLTGYALCTNDDCKPVFVSSGYASTVDVARKLTLATMGSHRLPQPLYQADHCARKKLDQLDFS